jgi:LPXTG-motif cell wall-anchored protein
MSEQRSTEAIEGDIERTREQLGDTVEALAAKADVKAHAQARVAEVKQQARERATSPAALAAGGAVALLLVAAMIRRRRRRN